MKCLTLNTHSWMEEQPLEKLEIIAQFILRHDFDWVALQEVNQSITSEALLPDDYFCQTKAETIGIKTDNFALNLVERLQELGLDYYWSWTFSHIGYDRYEEGVALLSKTPFIADSLLVSPMDDMKDYHTRRQLMGISTTDTGVTYRVMSNHYSWWSENASEGFQYERQQLQLALSKQKMPTILMGDFNAPSHIQGESFTAMTGDFSDTFLCSKEVSGEATVVGVIDGWHDRDTLPEMRLDYILVPAESVVSEHMVVFDGKNSPIVSDHFGIMAEIKF